MVRTSRTIGFFLAQKRLSVLWFVFVGLIFVIMIFQTLRNKFGIYTDTVWNWLLPNVVPTLSIILSVFLAEFNRGVQSKRKVNAFYYKLVLGLSAFYLSSLLIITLSLPFLTDPYHEVIMRTNYFLIPLQSIVGIAMGFFFVKSSD